MIDLVNGDLRLFKGVKYRLYPLSMRVRVNKCKMDFKSGMHNVARVAE